MPRILCAGLIAADLVFEIDEFPKKGTKNRAVASSLIMGGGALNAATAIAGLGGDVTLAGTVGDDDFGTFLRGKMRERNIDDSLVQTIPHTITSRSANMISPDGDRTIVNHRAPALAREWQGLPNNFQFDAALVDTRWPEAAHQIVTAAQVAGKPAVVDAEAPVRDAEDALRVASHIVFSEQGLTDYCGTADAKSLATVARQFECWCAVTRGPDPVLCHDGDTIVEVSIPATIAVNTLGAGDVWHGAFTLALACARSEIDAVRWANAAASLKVRHPVLTEYSPSLAEVDALFAE